MLKSELIQWICVGAVLVVAAIAVMRHIIRNRTKPGGGCASCSAPCPLRKKN